MSMSEVPKTIVEKAGSGNPKLQLAFRRFDPRNPQQFVKELRAWRAKASRALPSLRKAVDDFLLLVSQPAPTTPAMPPLTAEHRELAGLSEQKAKAEAEPSASVVASGDHRSADPAPGTVLWNEQVEYTLFSGLETNMHAMQAASTSGVCSMVFSARGYQAMLHKTIALRGTSTGRRDAPVICFAYIFDARLITTTEVATEMVQSVDPAHQAQALDDATTLIHGNKTGQFVVFTVGFRYQVPTVTQRAVAAAGNGYRGKWSRIVPLTAVRLA